MVPCVHVTKLQGKKYHFFHCIHLLFQQDQSYVNDWPLSEQFHMAVFCDGEKNEAFVLPFIFLNAWRMYGRQSCRLWEGNNGYFSCFEGILKNILYLHNILCYSELTFKLQQLVYMPLVRFTIKLEVLYSDYSCWESNMPGSVKARTIKLGFIGDIEQ